MFLSFEMTYSIGLYSYSVFVEKTIWKKNDDWNNEMLQHLLKKQDKK